MVQAFSPARTGEERPTGVTPEETKPESEEIAEQPKGAEAEAEEVLSYVAQVKTAWEQASEDDQQELLKSDFLKERVKDLRRHDLEDLNQRYQEGRNKNLAVREDTLRLETRFAQDFPAIFNRLAQEAGADGAVTERVMGQYARYALLAWMPEWEGAIQRSEPFKDEAPTEWEFGRPGELTKSMGPWTLREAADFLTNLANSAYRRGLDQAEPLAAKKSKELVKAAEQKGRATANVGRGPRTPASGGGSGENLSTFSGIARAVQKGHISQEEGRKRWAALETGG